MRKVAFSLVLFSALFTNALFTNALFGGNSLAAQAVGEPPGSRKAARQLPAEVTPQLYNLRLKPDLDKGTFTGVETIDLKVSQPSIRILLNAKELHITQASLTDSQGKKQNPAVEMLAADEMVAFSTALPLAAGDYKLDITYDAKLNDKLVGFYKSSFKDSKGKEHNLAVTQFEPVDARRMFPCFDEPQMKAHFKVSVDTKKELAAISNAPVEKETVDAHGNKLVEFAETPPMSTYLLAVAVGPFEPTPPVVVQGVPIRVWAVKGKSGLGIYSRDAAAKILPVLVSYFGIEYPWKKLDLLAIPDFEAGAMENPGAITFRETLLLVDPKTVSSSAQFRLTSVEAHEMAHLWFGDLVTMKWWDDLWLNEAFATWMSTRTVNVVHPEWNYWKEYSDNRAEALKTDSLHSTRAIHNPVTSPEQAHEMFDVITYEKGASVLRMLERYVGEPKFQEGIHKYLSEHSFANATTEDLWGAVGTVSGAPVKEVMNGWVHQPGYPVLTVSHTAPTQKGGDGGEGGNRISINQERFFLAGQDGGDKSVWSVPVCVRSLNSPPSKSGQTEAQIKLLLDSPSKTFTLSGIDSAASGEPVVIANAGGVGYYRLRYPQSDSAAITANLQAKLDPSERLMFLDDTWNMAVAGDIPIEQYLNLLNAYRAETDSTVWSRILGELGELDYFVSDAARLQFEKYVRYTLSPIKQKLGWQAQPGDSQETRILRGEVIEDNGVIGRDPDTIKHARILFNSYLKNKQSVDPDLVSPISSIVAHNGTAADYSTFKHLYQTARTPEEEHRNLFVLAVFTAPALVASTLNMSVDGSVRLQDAPGLLSELLRERRTGQVAWQFTQKNWDKISRLYSVDMLPRVVSGTGSFNTPSAYEQVKSFFAQHPVPAGKTRIARTVEEMRINVSFRRRSAKRLNEWLQHRGG